LSLFRHWGTINILFLSVDEHNYHPSSDISTSLAIPVLNHPFVLFTTNRTIKYAICMRKYGFNSRFQIVISITVSFLILLMVLSACRSGRVEIIDHDTVLIDQTPSGMSEDEVATLANLEQIDEYPLYTMTYLGDYSFRDGGNPQ